MNARGEDTGDLERDPRFGLEEALDGELPRETVDRMRGHTEECPECADEWERLRRLKELVRRSCQQDVAPRSLRERISSECQGFSITRTQQVTRIDAEGRRSTVTRTIHVEGGPLAE